MSVYFLRLEVIIASNCIYSFRYDMKRHTLAVEAFLEVEKNMDKSPDWQVYYYLGEIIELY